MNVKQARTVDDLITEIGETNKNLIVCVVDNFSDIDKVVKDVKKKVIGFRKMTRMMYRFNSVIIKFITSDESRFLDEVIDLREMRC